MQAVIGPAADEDFARIAGTEFLLIKESASSRSLTRELGWNAACCPVPCLPGFWKIPLGCAGAGHDHLS